MGGLKPLTLSDVEIKVICEVEDLQPEDYSEVPDHIDTTYPERYEVWLEADDDHPRVWMWCYLTVRVTWKDLVATSTLGGCSFDSLTDFMADDLYVEFVDDAFDSLVKRVASYQRPDDTAECATSCAPIQPTESTNSILP